MRVERTAGQQQQTQCRETEQRQQHMSTRSSSCGDFHHHHCSDSLQPCNVSVGRESRCPEELPSPCPLKLWRHFASSDSPDSAQKKEKNNRNRDAPKAIPVAGVRTSKGLVRDGLPQGSSSARFNFQLSSPDSPMISQNLA